MYWFPYYGNIHVYILERVQTLGSYYIYQLEQIRINNLREYKEIACIFITPPRGGAASQPKQELQYIKWLI